MKEFSAIKILFEELTFSLLFILPIAEQFIFKIQLLQIANSKIICTYSTETCSKLRNAGVNNHLPNKAFLTAPFCAGVSDKYYVLTPFFISVVQR